jgi:predicted nucleic acid-binding protein
MKFVLDCSVTMAWCFEDETNSYTERVLDSFQNGFEARVPPIWQLEVVNVLLVGIRKKRIQPMIAHHFKNALSNLSINIDRGASDRVFDTVFELAKEFELSAYEAAYLELAAREQIPIATQDSALIKAAKKQKIMIFHPK